MSAGAAGVLAPAPARMPSRTVRPQLRLVGPDECVVAPSALTKRLTRRGRLVITLATAVTVATLAVVHAPFVEGAALRVDHATTVSAGQTLSEVDGTQLPRLPIHDAVALIQLANGLNTFQVHSGQVLLIPAAP